MKRIFALIMFLFVGFASFASEWENNISLGVSFPQIFETLKSADIDGSDMKYKGHGFSFQFKDVSTYNRFVLFSGLEVGGISSKDIFNEKTIGFHFSGDIGAGFAFLNDEKLLVALGGVFGVTLDKFSGTYKYRGMVSGTYVSMNIDEDILSFLFNFGADLYVSYRFTNLLGIYIDVRAMYGFGSTSVDAKTRYGGYSASASDSYSSNGFIITPAVGLSIHF